MAKWVATELLQSVAISGFVHWRGVPQIKTPFSLRKGSDPGDRPLPYLPGFFLPLELAPFPHGMVAATS